MQLLHVYCTKWCSCWFIHIYPVSLIHNCDLNMLSSVVKYISIDTRTQMYFIFQLWNFATGAHVIKNEKKLEFCIENK